jgi:hypothetical protein
MKILPGGPSGAFDRYSAAKDLNGGKLNEPNQDLVTFAVRRPGSSFPSVKARDRGLKVARPVKAAVNHLRLTSGNRLTVPVRAGRTFAANRGA